MADGPLGRARAALLDARARATHSPSAANNKALEEAQAHMDYLLDTLPLPQETPPPTPEGPGASHPGPSVSPLFVVGGEHWPEESLTEEVLSLGTEEGEECTPTTQPDTDSEDV